MIIIKDEAGSVNKYVSFQKSVFHYTRNLYLKSLHINFGWLTHSMRSFFFKWHVYSLFLAKSLWWSLNLPLFQRIMSAFEIYQAIYGMVALHGHTAGYRQVWSLLLDSDQQMHNYYIFKFGKRKLEAWVDSENWRINKIMKWARNRNVRVPSLYEAHLVVQHVLSSTLNVKSSLIQLYFLYITFQSKSCF